VAIGDVTYLRGDEKVNCDLINFRSGKISTWAGEFYFWIFGFNLEIKVFGWNEGVWNDLSWFCEDIFAWDWLLLE
jgi:hypothetical protein